MIHPPLVIHHPLIGNPQSSFTFPLRAFASPMSITFSRDGQSRILHTEQWLPALLEQVFAFFSDAFQLERITPPWLRLQVVTPRPIQMQAGQLLDYRLRLRGIPIRWQSEISVWDPPLRFVDRQVKGPYTFWNHEHTFFQRDGGTLVVDHIAYRVPGGRFSNWLLVERDLRRIFEYRRKVLAEVFSGPPAAAVARERVH